MDVGLDTDAGRMSRLQNNQEKTICRTWGPKRYGWDDDNEYDLCSQFRTDNCQISGRFMGRSNQGPVSPFSGHLAAQI